MSAWHTYTSIYQTCSNAIHKSWGKGARNCPKFGFGLLPYPVHQDGAKPPWQQVDPCGVHRGVPHLLQRKASGAGLGPGRHRGAASLEGVVL